MDRKKGGVMDRDQIIATYDRIEAEHGGLAKINPQYVVKMTADHLGINYEAARDVMIDHWTMRGGG